MHKCLIETFYLNNHTILSTHYPGLSANKFKEYFYYYCHSPMNFKDFIRNLPTLTYLEKWSIFKRESLLGRPFSYLTKNHFFYNSEVYVTSDCLIPRFETEYLVDAAIKEIARIDQGSSEKVVVVEVGVGSGIIGLNLLQSKTSNELHFIGTDISEKALRVAEVNFYRHEYLMNPKSKVEFRCVDRLDTIDEGIDLIVTNPPYIKELADKQNVHEQVKRFEPHVALFHNDAIYEKWFSDFFNDSVLKLKSNGVFMMEGHEDHLNALAKMANDIFHAKPELIKDLSGRDRFLKIRK